MRGEKEEEENVETGSEKISYLNGDKYFFDTIFIIELKDQIYSIVEFLNNFEKGYRGNLFKLEDNLREKGLST